MYDQNPRWAPKPLISKIHLRYDTRYLSAKDIELFERCFYEHVHARDDLAPNRLIKLGRYDTSVKPERGDDGYGYSLFTVCASREHELVSLELFKEYVAPLRKLQAEGKARADAAMNSNGGEQ